MNDQIYIVGNEEYDEDGLVEFAYRELELESLMRKFIHRDDKLVTVMGPLMISMIDG